MALHNSTHSLIHEALIEYLAIAEHCISTGKPTGGCYGLMRQGRGPLYGDVISATNFRSCRIAEI